MLKHSNNHSLKGKRIDGIIVIQKVPFHIKGVIKKFSITKQRCIVATQINPNLSVPAASIRKLL